MPSARRADKTRSPAEPAIRDAMVAAPRPPAAPSSSSPAAPLSGRPAAPRLGAPEQDAAAKLTALFKRTKENQVADFLRERIIWGFYPRGQKLKQAEVAEMLDISITPVREALKILEAEGYVVGTSHRGAVVAPFQIERTEELLQLRVMLELRLTRIALGVITPTTLDALTALNTETEAASHSDDRDATRRTNYHFHFSLYELANQPQTLHFVRVLWAKYPFDKLTAMPNRLPGVAAEHETFLAAVRAGDTRAALKAMQFHIENGWREFKRNYPLYNQK